MHLNQLYGYFGRKQDLLETINIDKKDLILYVGTRLIKTMIEIDENTLSLLVYSNLNEDLISEINSSITLKISNPLSFVKSNVGIASAVTAYARTHMIPFKLNNDVYYSDTDSVFVGNKLDDKLIGKEIGLMKDELNGLLIDKAYFLGIKQYGYSYHDAEGQVNEKSVFAGVKRDSLTFKEIEKIYNGETLLKDTDERFFKSLKNLSVKIKPSHTNIVRSYEKNFVGNDYQPVKIDLLTFESSKLNTFLRIILKSLTHFGKYFVKKLRNPLFQKKLYS